MVGHTFNSISNFLGNHDYTEKLCSEQKLKRKEKKKFKQTEVKIISK